MTDAQGPWFERPLARTAGVLALLAYLPALSAAPGRMPSDSKLYLYLDPGRFFGDAASTFDGRQFAGWVPHQHIAYLWPSGPWFWLFELIGVPDWIAHRLWIGTLMFAAGMGVRWCARLLGLAPMAAFAAAITYQLSLYVLPYVSRTSVMLLPWAGLGWIVAFTIRASNRRTWGDPAAIALVVLTVGAVNATALAMIVPAPVLWLVHAAWRRSLSWRHAGVVALRIAVLCGAVSVWWIAMLLIQGRSGTDVLPYSESLADVSLTATSSETWRALGYWLFYIRDPSGAATTESLRYLASSPAIFVSFVVPLLALVSLAWVRWAHRRFAALLVATGMVLAVGVHPVADRSPLMRVVAGDDESGLALALRSSTRAIPIMMLGIALAIAMAVEASSTSRLRGIRAHWVTGAIAAGVAIVNLPALWTGGFVDPALERDQDPPTAWTDASAALDTSDGGSRVLQLPGTEFGSYRWGHTVDQPLPGLTEQPLVTRDLLPLGSAGAMDLLFALDDRIQDGVLEPESLAPVARLLGVDTVWLTNDIAFDRFRTARPEVVREVVSSAPGIEPLQQFGDPFLNRPDVPVTDERAVGDPRVGEPLVPVELASLADPGRVVRAVGGTLVVSGSGDGLVDAAAAGLIDPARTAARYSADLAEPDAALADAVGLVVTDSNRDRARHWRSSQDTVGYTEPGGPAEDVLRPVASDARLDVFDTVEPESQTIALQRGAVTAAATSYGEPFAYLPEHRPFMAIDGDPRTAWVVGEHGDPIGETLRLQFDAPVGRLVLHQPDAAGDRHISAISFEATGGTTSGSMDLDETSWNGVGQELVFPADVMAIDITIEAVTGGTPFTASKVAAVGFAEIEHELGPTVEVVRPPHDALAVVSATTALALTFTRLRTDPMDRWRDDPEPSIVREFDLATDRTFDVALDVRIDARASDAALADLFGWPAVASTRLTGSPRHAGVAALDGDPSSAWITAFDQASGATLTTTSSEPIGSIEVVQPVAGFSRVKSMLLRSGTEERVIDLTPDAAGRSTSEVVPPLPAGEVTFVLADVDTETTIDRRFADPVALPAAIAELQFVGRPAAVAPGDATTSLTCVPVATIDGQAITATIDIAGDAWLDGAALAVAPCDDTVQLGGGSHLVEGVAGATPLQLDRVVLDDGVSASIDRLDGRPTATVLEQTRFDRSVRVEGCTSGCWLIVGEGHNDRWSADGPDGSFGPPSMIDGGFNGWWIAPTDGDVVVDVSWTAQRGLTIALLFSALATLATIGLLVWDRRRLAETGSEPSIPPSWWSPGRALSMRTAVACAVAWATLGLLLVSPVWAVWGAVGGVAMIVGARRHRIPELTAVACLLVVAIYVVVRERRVAPLPDGGWPTTFDAVHALGMFAVVSVLVAALFADDADPGPRSDAQPA